MLQVNPNEALKNKISLLEIKSKQEFKELKQQFHITYESLKPVNLIKDTFKELTQTADLKNFIAWVIFLISGIFSQRIRNLFSPFVTC